ncbi:MAG: MFS transporter [bacterium]|nr:MFS transporter [bacterium]
MSTLAPAATGRRLGEREFILFIAMISAVSALAIDTLLPAFSEMRDAFNLPEDSTGLSLTITLFFVGSGIGNLVYGPMADALGRKRILVGSMVLYGLASLMATLSVTLGMGIVTLLNNRALHRFRNIRLLPVGPDDPDIVLIEHLV